MAEIRTVSLDRETVDISKEIPNFSRWIRAQLRAYDHGEDLVTLERVTRLWSKVATMMGEMIYGQNPDDYEDKNQVIYDFMTLAKSQTSLGDFE